MATRTAARAVAPSSPTAKQQPTMRVGTRTSLTSMYAAARSQPQAMGLGRTIHMPARGQGRSTGSAGGGQVLQSRHHLATIHHHLHVTQPTTTTTNRKPPTCCKESHRLGASRKVLEQDEYEFCAHGIVAVGGGRKSTCSRGEDRRMRGTLGLAWALAWQAPPGG